MKRLLTGLVLVPAILIFLIHGFCFKIYFRDPVTRRRRLAENVTAYSRFALRVLGIHVIARGLRPSRENFLVVCNHMSYVDLLVIASVFPAIFVTSIDMGEVFFLGTMAEIGGSLFIERRHRQRLGHDVEQIANVLREGRSVVLFPEGTSSDGTTVLPFKKGLFAAAPEAGVRVLPLTLRYESVNGEPFGPRNHRRVCWYGDMNFVPHFLSLLSLSRVEARLQFHPPLTPDLSRRPQDLKEPLARETQRVIAAGYHESQPIPDGAAMKPSLNFV